MWTFEGKEVTVEDIPQGAIGFVYCITDLRNGKKYVGKKTVFSKRKLPPLKGKTRRRSKIVETDWKDYYGSSEEVKQLVEDLGRDAFSREILHFCYNKSEMSYLELVEQVDRKVLLNDDYYNMFIGVKLHAKGLERLKNGGSKD